MILELHRQGVPVSAMRQARSGLAAEGEGDMALEVAQPLRPARPWHDDVGQTLGEDPAGAGACIAAEPSRLDLQDDASSLPGQIGQDAPVPAMDPARGRAADRAGGGQGGWPGQNGDVVGFGQNLLDQQTARDQGQEMAGQLDMHRMGKAHQMGISAASCSPCCTKAGKSPGSALVHRLDAAERS